MKKLMYKILPAILIMLVMNYTLRSQTSGWIWAGSGGGPGMDEGRKVCRDKSGNILVSGIFSEEAVFSGRKLQSGGQTDFFVAKYSKSGKLIWIQSAGNTGMDESNGIVTDKNNNVFVTGFFNGTLNLGAVTLTSNGNRPDIFLLKYDSNGQLLWAKKAGGTGSDYSNGIAADGLGNIIIAGAAEGNAYFDHLNLSAPSNSKHFFVAKYDNDGKVQFVSGFEGKNSYAASLVTDHQDNIIVAGGYGDTMNIRGHLYVANGLSDPFVMKFFKDGTPAWTNLPQGNGNSDKFNDVAVDENDNLYLAGTFSGKICLGKNMLICAGDVDAMICSTDSSGKFLWADKMGGSGFDQGLSICCSRKTIYMTGFTDPINGNGTEMLIQKYEMSGTLTDVIIHGGKGGDFGRDLCADPDGNIYLTGSFSDEMKCGNTTLKGEFFEMFLAHYRFGPPAPIIIHEQPLGSSHCAGDDVTFTIHASGKNLKFQWKFDGIPIPGATDTFFNVSKIEVADQGSYSCQVSDSGTSLNSFPAFLSVSSGPIITFQPEDRASKAGSNISFHVTAKGINISYQWQKDGVSLTGKKDGILLIESVKPSDSGLYRCIIKEMCKTDTSREARLDIIPYSGIDDRVNRKPEIFPNPARDFVQIRLPGDEEGPVTIRLFSKDGKQLLETSAVPAGKNIFVLNIQAMTDGIYIMQISSSKHRYTSLLHIF